MEEQRRRELEKFESKVLRITEPEVAKLILIGICSLVDTEDTALYRDEFVTSKNVAEAMKLQEEIGWEHFTRGRFLKIWSTCGPNEKFVEHPQLWAKKMALYMIKLGTDLWKLQNNFIHGNSGMVLNLEVTKMTELIKAIYTDILPSVHPSYNWLFQDTLDNKLRAPHAVQTAWVDSVRRLLHQEYRELKTEMGKIDFRRRTMEYNKANGEHLGKS